MPRGAMTQRANIEALLTVQEVAAFLRVAPGTLYNWAYRGRIPVQKVGGRLLFSPTALRRWLRQHEQRVAAEAVR
jgi:excisionase family DNA binding protein